jgi:thiamine-phosphate diphosphorylase
MIQYILTKSSRFSVAELAQMAIEAGCQWINLSLDDSDDDIKADIVPDVIQMCREAGVILTIDDHFDLAREIGLHGVRVHAGPSTPSPAELREKLGPEAMIGYVTPDPTAIPAMIAADIDYAATPANFDAAARAKFIETVNASGYMLPVVATGNFSAAELADVLKAGFNGVAVSHAVTGAPDPVVAMQALIAALPQ